MSLTHIDENNQPNMVDVGQKQETQRQATASGIIKMSQIAFETIQENKAKKGPVLQTAIIAAIMGAKKTSELIPMCHPLMLNAVKCDIQAIEDNSFKVFVIVKTHGKTGVEMEALNGVSIALLTIYDMIKAIDKAMVISNIQLEDKQGGKSGTYSR